MGTATLTRRRTRPDVPKDAPTATARRVTVPRVAFALLCLLTLVGFFVYPTYPNYDSYYSLLWGQEVLRGEAPSFDAYRTPTEHPLAVAFGAVLSLLGDPADRVMLFATLASFVALVAGLHRLAAIAFTPWVGLVAGILLCTRFDYPFLAIRGYIDVPYLAFVVWAGALEAARPRRGFAVYLLLLLAGLMRPEAWVLIGLYWLWRFPTQDWPGRVREAVVVVAAPLLWFLVDYLATGDPLFSLNHTSGLAEELGRQRGLTELPAATVSFIRSLARPPVFLAGILGLGLALWLVPRRIAMPFALLAAGAGTFLLVGAAGLSVIFRYLLVPAMMMMVFAGFLVAGFTVLERGRLRTAWAVASAVLVVAGVAFTASRVSLDRFHNELAFRGDSHAALEEILADPAVQAGRRCGPISVPNHKLIPDVRWVLGGASEDEVVARSDPEQEGRVDRGVALFATDRTALLRQALVGDTDDPLDSVPAPGFVRVATSDFYGAYVRC